MICRNALLGRFLPRLGPLWRHGGLLFGENRVSRCPGRGQAGREDVDFDSERHAVERGQLRALPPAQGRSLRCLARRRPIFSNNRVYRRIDLVDARVDRLKSLRGRESSIRITPRQSRCVEFPPRLL
jgi:hypothetical protein